MRVPSHKESCWWGHEQVSVVRLYPFFLRLFPWPCQGVPAGPFVCGNPNDSANSQSIYREPNQSLRWGINTSQDTPVCLRADIQQKLWETVFTSVSQGCSGLSWGKEGSPRGKKGSPVRFGSTSKQKASPKSSVSLTARGKHLFL